MRGAATAGGAARGAHAAKEAENTNNKRGNTLEKVYIEAVAS